MLQPERLVASSDLLLHHVDDVTSTGRGSWWQVIRDPSAQAQVYAFGSTGAGTNASYLWLGGAVPVDAQRPLSSSLEAREQLVWVDGRCASPHHPPPPTYAL